MYPLRFPLSQQGQGLVKEGGEDGQWGECRTDRMPWQPGHAPKGRHHVLVFIVAFIVVEAAAGNDLWTGQGQ